MASPLWRLAVRSDFSAGHALRHYEGKCESPHGHNFAVEVVVEGEKLSEDTELLMDFKEIKTMLKAVLEQLDHKDLNLTPMFSEKNPSSENIAAWIYKQMQPGFEGKRARLYSVSVSEKAAQTATYMEI
ncbi:6-carboxytetrahydropterin synthase QueD [Desulfovibrio sp. OttesenSCG-928-C06]|nr:6-carboxytetrahydropterin synthase QueD [Desulfovibrio sp. OttesenSCG-928-C06]